MAIPNKGQNIIRRSIKVQDEAAAGLLDGLDAVERAIMRAIMRKINKMSEGPDGIRFTEGNAKLLTALRQRINDLVLTGAYREKVAKYAEKFGLLDGLLIEKHEAINGITFPKSLTSDIRNFSIREAQKDLIGSGFKAKFIDSLMADINMLVATGADFGHIQDAIEAKVAGGLTGTVRQVAVDTINQYQGRIDQKIGKEFGYEWIVYSGSIIKTTRCQCARWVNMRYLHKSQLQKELNWALGGCSSCGGRKCSGMIKGTTPDTFVINRGGFNCRHDATWVDSAVVPPDKVRLFEMVV